ncbi:MAG: PAS domain S-box protein [Synechocystis sp.]|nr:PAS domain S-box protein [Synechocystis sp.]
MSALPSAKLLLVDDQPDSLMLLAKALEPLAIEIIAVNSGEAAIAEVKQSEFALIVLDVKMPGLDGFQTASLIRTLPNCAATPIIFITAHAIQPDQIFHGYETGAIDYLIKPINVLILLSKARLYLQFFQQQKVLQNHSYYLENLVEANTLSLIRSNQSLQIEVRRRRRLEQILKIIAQSFSRQGLQDSLQTMVKNLSKVTGITHVWFKESSTARVKLDPMPKPALIDSPWIFYATQGHVTQGLPDSCQGLLQNHLLVSVDQAQVIPIASGDPDDTAPPSMRDGQTPQTPWKPLEPSSVNVEPHAVLGQIALSAHHQQWQGQFGFIADTTFGDRQLMTETLQISAERICLEIDYHFEQTARRKIESLNRHILSAISDAVFITKTSGEFTFICPNVHHIFAYSIADVEAMGNIQALLGPLNLDVSQLAETGELKNCPYTIQDKAGKSHNLLVTIKKVEINDGDYLFTCRDISERVEAERRIQENEANFRNIFTHVSDGLLVINQTNQICFANASAEKFLTPSSQALIRQAWQTEATIQRFELDIDQTPQTHCTVDVVITDMQWQGEPAKLASLRDITERKVMENQLRENEQKYYHLLENINSGVIVHSADAKIIYANPIAKQFLGLTAIENREIEDYQWQLFDSDGEVIAPQDFPVHRVLAHQEPLTNFEIGIYRQDLKLILWSLVNAYPEFDEQQQLQRVIVTFSEITERKQAEIELKTINENLEFLIEERTQVLEATNEQLLQEIAEREKVSQVLAHQEARYRALVRDASDAIIVTTMDLKILEVNHRTIALSGYAEGELIDQSLTNLNLFAEQFNRQQKVFWRTLNHQKIAQLSDVKLRKNTGELISVDISASIITYEDDAIIKFIVHDITLQKTIQIQLEQENHFRQQILDNMVEGLCICHEIPEFPFVHFTVWNPMMEKITGYSQADINRLGWYQQLYPDQNYQKRAIARMKAMRKGNNILAEEWQITRKDGNVRTIQISTALLKNSQNKTNVLALIQDITHQKEQIKIIEENELTFRSIVENLPIFFGMRDPDHQQWYYINPYFKILTGYESQAMYDNPLLWRQFFHPEDLATFLKRLETGFPYGEQLDFRMTKKDGTEIWLRVLEFLIDEQYTDARVVSFAQDITEIKRAEAEVYKALNKERELNQIKSQFVDIVSHEFRTPLTSILGFSELLTRHFDRLSSEKKLHYITNIQNASLRLSQLIDDVLRISRYDANKLEISLGITNIEFLGNEIIEAFGCGLGKDHRLQFNYHLPPGIKCLLDVNLLRHVLDNLLSNAIKYSPVGSTVTLEISQADDQLLFQVSDQGIGIPEADQEALFEAFHRASNVGDVPGTGLGLSIVKRYVSFQGGRVDFVSVPNQGTTFVVRLPMVVS